MCSVASSCPAPREAWTPPFIEDMATQICPNFLHMMLCCIGNVEASMKLHTNRMLKQGTGGVPELKSPEERRDWNGAAARGDNTVPQFALRRQGYIADVDVKAALGFAKPMKGMHCNQCLVVIAKVKDLAELPFVKLLDSELKVTIDSVQRGLISTLLSSTADLLDAVRHDVPCLHAIETAMRVWWAATTAPEQLVDHGPGAYDHAICDHLLPPIRRYLGIIHLACFGPEHDNGVLRGLRKAHSAGSANGKGWALVEMFQRQSVTRCDAMHDAMKQLLTPAARKKPRTVPVERHCDCEKCRVVTKRLDAEMVVPIARHAR